MAPAARMLVGVTALVLLAGCGDGLEERSSITWPVSASAAVVTVDSGGGLPPPDPAPSRFGEVPDFVLYGDGTGVWNADGDFRSARLDEEGVRTVLGWANEAGLLAPGGVDTGEPQVYDVGVTRYEVATDAGTVQTQVDAPGFEDEAVGLSIGEIEARARLEDFRQRLFDLPEALPEGRFLAPEGPFVAQGWELLTRPSTAYDRLTGDEPRWTFDDPSVVGRCRVVTGVDQARLEADIGATGEGRVWAVDGEPWLVVARPLLPGSAAPCPAHEQGP